MTSTLISSYLGFGLASARPSTPATDANAAPFWYSTDTNTLSQYIPGTGWVNVGGGYSAGTPPTVVQSQAGNTGGATGGGAGLTLGSAPVNGNLLIAMAFNPTTNTPGSGWTSLATNSSGTDFGTILYKVAGAGESTTQTPMSGTVNAPACMAMWEIHGQNATIGTALVPGFNTTEAEQTVQLFSQSVQLPSLSNFLFLGAIGLVSSSTNLVKTFNVTQDQFLNSGTGRQIAAGHSTLANAPLAQIIASLSGSSSYKACGLLISS